MLITRHKNSKQNFKVAQLLPIALLALLNLAAPAKAEDSIAEAQKVFRQFVELEKSFDPSLADLFAPNAVIKDVRVYQDGQTKTITWSGSDYKQVLRAGLPIARARNDVNTYGPANYYRDGNNIRIKTTRQSVLKKYTGPFELVIAPIANNGKSSWKILEEVSQSEP